MNEIRFDGAARPNPGEMGVGVVLLQNGIPIKNISKRLEGKGPNNYAEYGALICGLDEALKEGWGDKPIMIKGDSELAVRQIKRKYKVRAKHLKPLYDKVRSLLKKFSSYNIQHIGREENKLADRLAGDAIKHKHEIYSLTDVGEENKTSLLDFE